jgi:hypothetical protein
MSWEDQAERVAERTAGRAADKAAKRVGKGISDFGSSIMWTVGFGLLFVGVFGCVICGVGGYVAYVVMGSGGGGDFSASGPVVEKATWDGKSTFKCGGNDKVTLSGVSGTVEGVGVDAGGNCKLTLDGVDVTAGTALKVGGNAKVTMIGGSLTGTEFAISAGGNGKIDLQGTKTEGEIKTGGLAKVTGGK